MREEKELVASKQCPNLINIQFIEASLEDLVVIDAVIFVNGVEVYLQPTTRVCISGSLKKVARLPTVSSLVATGQLATWHASAGLPENEEGAWSSAAYLLQGNTARR